MYRHIDLLNAAGLPAAALHQRPGFRYSWFANDTIVTDVRSSAVGPDDVLVLPELDVDLVAGKNLGIRHIVLNQSGHLTWNRAPDEVIEHYRTSADLLGTITVSEHSVELVAHAFPQLPVHRVRGSVDPSVFGPAVNGRERVISYLPRRGRAETAQVIHILKSRGALEGWQLQPLHGLSQAEFADRLRSSTIMLSLSYQEGFGLPPVEAMACGNYVIGFHGFGGREFFRPEFSCPVETADVLAVARAVEDAVSNERQSPGWCAVRGAAASRFVLSEYSPEQERTEARHAYTDLINRGTAS
jgi:hypothetical protein